MSKSSARSLDRLEEGEEWLAVTFREQTPMHLSSKDIGVIFSTSDATVKYAYQRMMRNENHPWASKTKYEVDFIIKTFNLEKNASILDIGCGSVRHSIELAKLGYKVTCVNFVKANIDYLKKIKSELNLDNLIPIFDDCRIFSIKEKFKYIICLYDVIEAFPSEIENLFLVKTLANHLLRDGKILISTMNLELSKQRAKIKKSVLSDPDILLSLPSSNIMEISENIFDPNYYIYDAHDNTFYRKEN